MKFINVNVRTKLGHIRHKWSSFLITNTNKCKNLSLSDARDKVKIIFHKNFPAMNIEDIEVSTGDVQEYCPCLTIEEALVKDIIE